MIRISIRILVIKLENTHKVHEVHTKLTYTFSDTSQRGPHFDRCIKVDYTFTDTKKAATFLLYLTIFLLTYHKADYIL